jgi:guanine deaminase
MMTESTPTRCGLRGRIIHTPVYGEVVEWRDGAVVWDHNGLILAAGDAGDVLSRYSDSGVEDVRPHLVVPGLVDTHTHLPQLPVAGVGAGELLEWLHRYVFPAEREFRVEQACALAPVFFRLLAAAGTTSAAVYLALWEDSAHVCFNAAQRSGLRVVMGKMMMDDETYSGAAPTRALELSLRESENLCREWNGRDRNRIRYAFSPRFAVACSEPLMVGAAELAQRYNAFIQTHLSESRDELRRVRTRFPAASDYTDVYDRAGLLGPRTIAGHAIWLNDRERARLAATGTSVAHCPTSNLYLASGLMDLGALREAGVNVGLGSDVAGGPDVSMWRVMRAAIEVRNTREAVYGYAPPFGAAEAFHLATMGGAAALGIDRDTGTIEAGKEADLLVLDPTTAAPPGAQPELMDAGEVLSLLAWRGDARTTVRTYVRGRAVYDAADAAPLAAITANMTV